MIPPVVHSRTAGGIAYLVQWQQLPDGSWGALIAWIVIEGDGAWHGRRLQVTAADITRIQGQRYDQVSRRRVR